MINSKREEVSLGFRYQRYLPKNNNLNFEYSFKEYDLQIGGGPNIQEAIYSTYKRIGPNNYLDSIVVSQTNTNNNRVLIGYERNNLIPFKRISKIGLSIGADLMIGIKEVRGYRRVYDFKNISNDQGREIYNYLASDNFAEFNSINQLPQNKLDKRLEYGMYLNSSLRYNINNSINLALKFRYGINANKDFWTFEGETPHLFVNFSF